MRLHRFFAPNIDKRSGLIVVEDQKLLHQWRNVFKMKAGQKLALFDGSGVEIIAAIESLKKEAAVLRVEEKTEKTKGIAPEREVWLFFSLIKKDNAEFVLEKGTELGVSHFVPVVSERSEKKGLNAERARKIIIEAAEQCGRSDIPELHLPAPSISRQAGEIISLGEAIDKYGNKMDLVAFDPSGDKLKTSSSADNAMGLFVGPEGGFTEKEISLFKEKNIPVYSLGELILRAETAAIAALAKILN